MASATENFAHQYPKSLEEVNENWWEEVDEEQYYEMLEMLPPAKMGSSYAFAVGEELCHLGSGEPVFDTYVKVDGRFFHKPLPLSLFTPAKMVAEVRKQSAEPEWLRPKPQPPVEPAPTRIEIGLGTMSERQARLVKEVVQGRSFYNFDVQWGLMAGGCPVTVSTTYEGALLKDVQEMLLYVLATGLK